MATSRKGLQAGKGEMTAAQWLKLQHLRAEAEDHNSPSTGLIKRCYTLSPSIVKAWFLSQGAQSGPVFCHGQSSYKPELLGRGTQELQATQILRGAAKSQQSRSFLGSRRPRRDLCLIISWCSTGGLGSSNGSGVEVKGGLPWWHSSVQEAKA